MKVYVVLITTPDRKTSEIISRGLVDHKLAACVNRVPGLASRYWWKGKVETAREELLIAKTSSSRWKSIMLWVRKNHPYGVCEILALPVAGGNPPYLEWILKSLK